MEGAREDSRDPKQDENNLALVSCAAVNEENNSQESQDIDLDQVHNELGDEYNVKSDSLGPIILNVDGTMGRVSNWAEMTDSEKEQAVRLISARNKRRKKEILESRNLHSKKSEV